MKTPTKKMKVIILFALGLILGTAAYSAENVKKESRSLDTFTAIKLVCSADLYITQGNQQQVKVVADERIMDHVSTEVENGVLIVDVKKNNFRRIETLDVYITVAQLDMIKTMGSGDIYGKDTFSGKDMEIVIKGSGNVDFNFDVQNLELGVYGSGDIDISGVRGTLGIVVSGSGDIEAESLKLESCSVKVNGSGDIELSGKTNELIVGVNGSGDIDGAEFMAVSVVARNSGSGDMVIHAIESLDIQLNGSGDVKYYGNPEKQRVDVRGSGEVYRK